MELERGDKMSKTIEQLKQDIKELRQQEIDAGYYGEEYELWKSKKPIPPRRLVLGCYEEVQPLYTFLVSYAQESAKASQPLPFDTNRLESYEKYTLVMRQFKGLDLSMPGFLLEVASSQVTGMLNGDRSYHAGMEMLYNSLQNVSLPSHMSQRETSRAYRGEHFEALVDRYKERIKAHLEEGNRIATDNLKKRGKIDE
jgi:hypothetical protein